MTRRAITLSIFRVTTTLAAGAALCQTSALARQCGSGWRVIPGQTGNPTITSISAWTLDTTRRRIVVSAGFSGTWEFDLATGAWSQPLASGPVPRNEATMVFDRSRGTCVMFGGGDGTGLFFAETWEWDGDEWILLGAGGGYQFIGGAYHEGLQRVVRLGGARPPTCGQCTWSFSTEFSSWSGEFYEAFASGSPSPFAFGAPAIVFDPASGGLLAVAGFACCTVGQLFHLPETWLHNGATWTRLTQTGPGSVSVIFRDAALGRIVAVSGASAVSLWNGAAWTALAEGVTPVVGEAYDPTTGHILGLKANGAGAIEAWARDLGVHPAFVVSRTPAAPTLTRDLGDSIDLRVATGGATPQTFEWRLNGAMVVNGGNVTGATSNRLRITGMTCEQYGVYEVVASSPCGATTPESWEILQPAAGITHPANATAAHGSTASFTAAIEDPNGPTSGFQWRRNGVPIPPGAPYSGVNAATLSINPATFAMNGDTFDAVVTRFCGGTLTTNAATLTVLCNGDANGDGIVNFADLNFVLSQFGQTGAPGALQGDVNRDGVVNFADLNLVLSLFGTDCL